MILNYNNLKITIHIIRSWIQSIYVVIFLSPSSYLSLITSEEISSRELFQDDWRLIKKVVKGVRRISPLFLKKRKCLMEALIVFHTLKSFGLSSVIRLGIKKEMKTPSAHAWVKVNDIVVIGGPVKGYEELIRTR